MNIFDTKTPAVKIIKPEISGDERFFFLENFNKALLDKAAGCHIDYVQENLLMSKKDVLRGIHYQQAPNTLNKLIQYVENKIFNFALDIRRFSLGFGQWVKINLITENYRQLLITKDFSRSFVIFNNIFNLTIKQRFTKHLGVKKAFCGMTLIVSSGLKLKKLTIFAKDKESKLFDNAKISN